MFAARLAKPSHSPVIDLSGDEHDGLHPLPSKVWKHTGPQPCPYCHRTARLVEYSMQGVQTEACNQCMASNGLSFALSVGVSRIFSALESGWTPSDPHVDAMLSLLDVEGALVGLLLAIDARYFMHPSEVRYSPVTAYLRIQGVAARAMLDPSLPPEFQPPAWVVPILYKLLRK